MKKSFYLHKVTCQRNTDVDSETAKIVLTGITVLAVIVWLIGLQFLLASARVGKPPEADLAEPGEPWPEGWLTGSAEVEGQPATLVKRAAALLVKGNAGTTGPLKIVECTDDHVVFERLGPATAAHGQANWFRRKNRFLTRFPVVWQDQSFHRRWSTHYQWPD